MINWATISLRDLAGFISEELTKKGIDTVLVGGACVTIYSDNAYQSYDLDYVTYDEMKKVRKALSELGFIEKQKYFQHVDCPWFVEFVSPPVAIGNEPIHKFNKIKTRLGVIKLLHPVDSVKDRLASFYHWDDKQGLEQAISICQEQNVNLKEVERWSLQENQKDKFNIFMDRLK
jgi:hypothetical protein